MHNFYFPKLFNKPFFLVPFAFFLNHSAFAIDYNCLVSTYDDDSVNMQISSEGSKYKVYIGKTFMGNFKLIENNNNFLHIFNSWETLESSMHIGIDKKTNYLISNLMDFKKERSSTQAIGSCKKEY